MKRFDCKMFRWSLLFLACQTAWAEDLLAPLPTFSQLNHGGVGLIQMPTARMNPDGDFTLGYRDNEEYRFWTASMQLFPWMETTVRYTDVRTKLYSADPGFSGDQTLKDKGIDVKFRLWQESAWLPAVSAGFRDFGGTGFFESEYIALAKRWRDVDVHVGMGWGYLGNSGNIDNPFCEIADRFCKRPRGFRGNGGGFDTQRFFKGPAAIYGGIEYQTPWQPLKLQLEYDGNSYKFDRAGVLKQDSRWNYAAVYRYNDQLDLTLSRQRGNTIGFGVNYRFNFHTASQIKIVPAPRIVPDRLPAAASKVERFDLSFRLYTEAGLVVDKYQLTEDTVVLQGYSIGFRDQGEFINRLGRVLATELPETVKSYRVTEMSGQLPMVETVINADKFVDFARKERLDSQLADAVVRQEPDLAERDWAMIVDNSGFYTGIDAFWIQTFGSPERFYMYQGGLLLSSGYNFDPNWSLNSTVKVNVLTNFDEFKFTKDAFDTGVPRVRTLIREYVQGNEIGLENLYGLWKTNLQKDWYAQVYAGYLETMYAGAGAEVLYRPIDSRLAIGVDVNYVGQRDFDRPLGLFDYRVVTGQVTAYWQPAFVDDVMLKVGVGRYLAKDHGVTVDFSRRFDSGVVVGAYATKTNLSAKQYGEGSFTKGFYLSFPFDLFSITPSIGRGQLPWVPISRDGGQPLNRPSQLFSLTDVRSPFSK